MKSQPFSYEEFKEIYSRVPRLAVELVIQTPEGVALTLRSRFGWENKWHMPGMTLLYKERVVDAIQRVAQEEAGVSVRVERLLGSIEYTSEEQERGFGWTVSLAFLCTVISGELRVNKDASDIKAFRKLPQNLIEEQRNILESVLCSS